MKIHRYPAATPKKRGMERGRISCLLLDNLRCHEKMAFVKLNDSKIRGAQPKEKIYRLADGKGLFLAVYPSGFKSWQFRYLFGEKEKTLTLGSYPEMRLSDAREERYSARKLLREHIDPVMHRREQEALAVFRLNDTFEKLAREWHERKSPQWSSQHAYKTLLRLEKHVFPYIGKRPIERITPLEILEVLHRLEKAGKTHMAHRIYQLVCRILDRAVTTQRLSVNPALSLKAELMAHKEGHYRTIKEAEIPQFLKELESVSCRELYFLAFWLLLLTGVRQCELRFSEKPDIDFENKTWTVRAEVAKMKREHVVVLSTQAIVVLERMFELEPDSKWLVPNIESWANSVMSEYAFTNMIKRMGYADKIVPHGVRSLFSTVLNDHGFDSKVIDRQLAHVGKDRVEAIYNRAEYEKQRRELMQWWGDFLDEKRPEGKRFCPKGFELRGSFARVTSYVGGASHMLSEGSFKILIFK